MPSAAQVVEIRAMIKQSFSGLQSPGRSYSWVETIYEKMIYYIVLFNTTQFILLLQLLFAL